MRFFPNKSAFVLWRRKIPWIDLLRADEQPPDESVEAHAVDVLFFDSEHLFVRTKLQFCAVARCEFVQEAELTWWYDGEQVFAKYLYWKESQSQQRVSGATLAEAHHALEDYLKGGLFSNMLARTTRKL